MFRIKQNIAMGLLLFLIITAVVPILASELDEQQQQVQQQMQVQQQKSSEAKQKVASVSEQLHKVQMELDNAQGDYQAIKAKLNATEEQIKTNTVILSKAEKDLAERSLVLNKRIRDIYQNGQLNYLDVLFGANDFGDFTTRMDLLKRIMNKDIELIVKVKAERELILQKKAELDSDKAAILQLEKAAVDKKKIIESSKKEREAVLSLAINERDTAEQSYQELLETSRKIEQMIRRNQNKQGPISGSGAMMWPTDVTEITSPYGWRTHPIFGTSRYHSGIDIGADYGDTVSAADSGVVIYADWMGGYGKAVIIDHGNGISTLYGHNSELLVSEGQRVRKGEAISRVGSTGYSTGPHLHFEVRQNGSPTDPMAYLP